MLGRMTFTNADRQKPTGHNSLRIKLQLDVKIRTVSQLGIET